MPKLNVLKYYLEDQSWFTLRPSGTEPKAKFYFGVKGSSLSDSQQALEEIQDFVMKMVHDLVSVSV